MNNTTDIFWRTRSRTDSSLSFCKWEEIIGSAGVDTWKNAVALQPALHELQYLSADDRTWVDWQPKRTTVGETTWQYRSRLASDSPFSVWVDVPKGFVENWVNNAMQTPELVQLRHTQDGGITWTSYSPGPHKQQITADNSPPPGQEIWRYRRKQKGSDKFTGWHQVPDNELVFVFRWLEATPEDIQLQYTVDNGDTWTFWGPVTADNSPPQASQWVGRIAGGAWAPVPLDALPVWQAAATADPDRFSLCQRNASITKAQLFEAALQADLIYPENGEFYCGQPEHEDLTQRLHKMAESLGVLE